MGRSGYLHGARSLAGTLINTEGFAMSSFSLRTQLALVAGFFLFALPFEALPFEPVGSGDVAPPTQGQSPGRSASVFFGVASGDVAPPTQGAGDHSTIVTSDGSIRDDKFVDEICDKIIANGGKVKDVKFMSNACYGGGILDDLGRVFGPGGKCKGIKWVGGTASAPDEVSYGWNDATINLPANSALNLGDTWTDALAGLGTAPGKPATGLINGGNTSDNVLQDLKEASNNDALGPLGRDMENPQTASGNGGDKITWNMTGAKHEAIVFGGRQTNVRHNHDIANVAAALNGVWGTSPHNIQKLDGGTEKDLLDAIDTAAGRLDENTQLVIYIDDHGGTSFDVGEFIDSLAPEVVIDEPTTISFDLHRGWFTGLWGNYFLNYFPNPLLYMTLLDPVAATAWHIYLNGAQLTSEATGTLSGQVSFFLPWTYLLYGHNELRFEPAAAKAVVPLRLSQLELDSSPINELEADQVLLPGQSAAYFDLGRNGEGVFVELLDKQKVVVYVFTYLPDGSGQAWFIGVGVQSSRGIVVTDLLRPVGGKFGPNFDAADVTNTPWGSLAMMLPPCGLTGGGSLIASPIPGNGFEHFEDFTYSRLTTLAPCTAQAKTQPRAKASGSGLSGSWFDPTHTGEGIILEVLADGSAVVQWFTYDQNGNQFWIQGTGTFNGMVLTVNDLFSTSGASWGSAFDPADVVSTAWGTLTMNFTTCDAATMDYNSTAGFGSGTLNMVRLTSLMGIPCS